MGVNKRSMDLQALRLAATSESVNPLTNIEKAAELLETFGPSRPNSVCVRTLIRRLEHFSSASLIEQRAVRTAVKTLKMKLERAIEVKSEQADEDEVAAPIIATPPPLPSTQTTDGRIGGIDLLPDPADDQAWKQLIIRLGYYQPLTKTELLAAIDIPLWIGECETVGRIPVNLRRPSHLQYHISDSELDWERTIDLACSGTREDRAIYRAESAARIHARLRELDITPEGYIAIPDFTARLNVAYESLQPPYITFDKSVSHGSYGVDSEPAVQLRLTDTGKKKQFINLLRARIKHGYTIYGKKSVGTVLNALVVA